MTMMTENSAHAIPADRSPAGHASLSKAKWLEPKITRLDAAMTDTVFNSLPDGDTSS